MKKKIFALILSAFLFLGFAGTNKTLKAEPSNWYLVTTSIEWINGQFYLVTTCTEQIDDDCNMPGSIHRVQLPQLPW